MPRTRFDGRSFDPATLQILYNAFDNVWKQMEPNTPPEKHERVRDDIAYALISMATAGQTDPNRLEVYAMDQARAAMLRARA